ncbi:LysR family transcriptional regulator [Nocardia arthritidis]|uniref:LysR family transcriptional regulator n=1 Tax=Nocardia arthritidis TaxID=228602 RepID=A0A6G9YMX8_9NOCA|nr:LysR family transcriptional regulator [Nocardia arthritidis]QIS14564.1 LysR family transcriptional regulator [Nocardia arthritidis]
MAFSIDARSLRYFLAVAEEGNFTRAAARVGIAQPALSAQIRRMEAQLGAPLLVRTTRRVELTPAGRLLAEEGPAALAAWDRLLARVRATAAGESGAMRIVFSASMGSDTAPALLAALERELPGFRLSGHPLPTPLITPEVASGSADAGITRSAQPIDGTRRFLLRVERRGVQLAADHPLTAHAELDLVAAARFPIMQHPRADNPAHYDEVRKLFAGLDPEFVEPVIAFDMSRGLISSGAAIAIVGESGVRAQPAGLRWIPLRDPGIELRTYLVLPRNSAPVSQQIRAVARELALERGWLVGAEPR